MPLVLRAHYEIVVLDASLAEKTVQNRLAVYFKQSWLVSI